LKVVCVIPAYNEERRIENVIKSAKRYVDKIIVVDDGSKDETASIAKKSGAKVIRYKNNKGVGYATKIGLKVALKEKPNILIFIDGDGQHNPIYIPKFINAIKNGAEYVYGLRDLYNYPLDRKIGNKALTFLTNLICPTEIKDTECGYRALNYSAAKKLELKANKYEREMDFIYEVWRNKFRVSAVKIKVPKFYPKFAIIRGFRNFIFILKRRLKII